MCCLFGLIDYKNYFTIKEKERIIKILSTECEVRGTDASGVAYVENRGIQIYKKPLPAHKIKFKFKGNPEIIMGHTRLTTQGNEIFNFNNHPFYSEKLEFSLAHNGVLHNDKELRKKERLPKTKIQTDSYIAVQLIEKKGTLDFDSVKFMAEKVMGSFCFTILSKTNELYFIKGNNPLTIFDFGEFYIYASTEDILKSALKRLKIKGNYNKICLFCGDILKINSDGKAETDKFNYCDFDYTYMFYDFYDREFYEYLIKRNDKKEESSFEDIYLTNIIEYAKIIGVDKEDIFHLLDCGYCLWEIENMLYEPKILDESLKETE